VLLVSHDRRFLDDVVTQTLAAEGAGRWKEYAGGYSDWLEQRPLPVVAPAAAPQVAPVRSKAVPTKLSYKESRELAQLPVLIEALEREQREITARMASPDYHRAGAAQMKADGLRSTGIEAELAAAFDRWAELEARAAALKPG
jgi:ATP-binding cassette subfamily F protein uup